MDEKQLDLNAPLLSVRRLSTTSSKLEGLSNNSSRRSRPTRQQSLPVPKSQWEPEPEDTKPAAIPFNWEQIPGKAKYPKKSEQKNIQNFPIDDQSSDDVPPDAIETLSMSFSCNFSEENSDLESSGSFSSDLQTRDYLMNRFLPAAKSMIVETPQYVAKKQEAPVLEPPKYVKKVYSGELRPLLLEKYPITSVSPYNHEIDKEINVIDDTKKKSSKKGFSFFLPRICTKRNSCLSNPTPGPKTKTPDSPGPIPRLSRRTSYSGPLTPSIEKQAMDAVIRKRAETRSKEVPETRKSTPLARSGNSLPSSPSRGMSRSGRISPYRNESPRSPFHDGARFLGVPKDVQNHHIVNKPKTCPSFNVKSNFHENPPVPEKTLYIDWIGKPTNVIPDDDKVEGNGGVDDSEVPRVPPLPKSPSESWLWKKMSLRSPFHKKVERGSIEKSDKNGPKWETIVKTSNVRNDHVRYSEERLNISKYTEISF
ncbi:uncharacterized protein LOC111885007 [Lactuca sativa]|uniref:Uncharacterized protein n=1 Tax=Lactuca sativa TaxID=4236 RepID=A0A9R1VTS1_LACSA|nr:uncharacterized protein LOC111885007 [Lactuca sativa]XP_023737080.1 uncharacterized protein LOC111885007 [Lactuca sativa]KAJ0211349.1 hypothetical protein LSAT_V11C400176280 [Lactuca sativa]